MRRKSGLYFLTRSTLLLMLFASLPSLHVKAQNQQGSMVGTWVNTVLVNTPSGPVPLLTELVAVNPGGIFTDAISIAFNSENPAFAGTPLAVDFSDAFGTWKLVGGNSNQFAATFKRFLFARPNTPIGAYGLGSAFPGQNVGMATIEAVGTLRSTASGDILSGSYTFQLTDLQGNLVLPASGTFSATRIQIQPLATP